MSIQMGLIIETSIAQLAVSVQVCRKPNCRQIDKFDRLTDNLPHSLACAEDQGY